ncbi:MAG: DnaD domain protein [Clostridia bacterium]|nr:DnaD domain protein [Clostridia bacterium]
MPEDLSFSIPGGVVSMTGEAAQRLISAGNGDAALLYLCLLHQGGDYAGVRKALGWPEDRLFAAYSALIDLKLTKPSAALDTVTEKPEQDEPPEYTAADIALELESGSSFSALVAEAQRRLGKVLSTTDLKILFTVYDFLALPTEVILVLITWCVRQTEEKYGQGRKPTMPQIRAEAFRWKRRGVDTPEGAEEYLRRMSTLQIRSARLLPLVGITGRAPVEGERKYLDAWSELGFEEDAVRLAYEKTVLKKQTMSWPYMNSILKSWHQKGLHTVAQIRSEDSNYRRDTMGGKPDVTQKPAAGAADKRVRDDFERMRRFLEEKKREEGGN